MVSPATAICGVAFAPGAIARVESVATESPETGVLMSPITRFTPMRMVFTTLRAEDVGVFNTAHLPAGEYLMDGVLQRIGLRLWAGIKRVAGGQRIVQRNLLVEPSREVVFFRDARQRHIQCGGIGVGRGLAGSGARPQR